jgi:hypothetical protein
VGATVIGARAIGRTVPTVTPVGTLALDELKLLTVEPSTRGSVGPRQSEPIAQFLILTVVEGLTWLTALAQSGPIDRLDLRILALTPVPNPLALKRVLGL